MFRLLKVNNLLLVIMLFYTSIFNLSYANGNTQKENTNYFIYNMSPYMIIPCYVNKFNNKIVCAKYEGLRNSGHTEDYLSGKYDFELNKSFLDQIKNKRTQHNSYDLTILLLNHMDYFAMYYPISDVNQAILYLNEKSKNNVVHIQNKIINSSLNYRRMYDKKRLILDNKFQNNKNQLIQMVNEYSGNPFMQPDTMSFQSIDFKNKDNGYNWYVPSKLKVISDKKIKGKHISGYFVKSDESEYEVFYIQENNKTVRFVKLKNQSQNNFFNKVLANEYKLSFLMKNIETNRILYSENYNIKNVQNLVKNWQEQLNFIQKLSLDNKNKQFIQKQLSELNKIKTYLAKYTLH